MDQARILTLVVALALIGCGSLAPIDLEGRDGAIADRPDGTPGTPDAGTPDPTPGTCEDWCRVALACRISNAIGALGSDVFGSRAECDYPEPARALSHCVDECSGRGTFPAGVPGACLRCDAANYRRSCSPIDTWLICSDDC